MNVAVDICQHQTAGQLKPIEWWTPSIDLAWDFNCGFLVTTLSFIKHIPHCLKFKLSLCIDSIKVNRKWACECIKHSLNWFCHMSMEQEIAHAKWENPRRSTILKGSLCSSIELAMFSSHVFRLNGFAPLFVQRTTQKSSKNCTNVDTLSIQTDLHYKHRLNYRDTKIIQLSSKETYFVFSTHLSIAFSFLRSVNRTN